MSAPPPQYNPLYGPWPQHATLPLLKHYLNEKQGVEYRFTKSKSFGKFIAGWCFVFTAFACILGMIPKEGEPFTSQWNFKLMLNILTPVVLLGLGLILPSIAKKEQAKNI